MTRAFYLDARVQPIFALLDEPSASASADRGAVLLCPPIGWQDVASYRPRRDWARELAAAGHPTLRIDLPGSGDSGGGPRDPGRFQAWIGAITAAARWLREQYDSPRLAAVGISLAATAVYAAAAGGAPIDDLVLWGASGRGRALVREQRAFARLEQTEQPLTEKPLVPDGAVMTAGFLLSAETVADLERFDVRELPAPSHVTRALLLERDGAAVDDVLRETLARAGADVTAAPGDGFADMLMVEPQDAKPAWGVLSTVRAWIDAAPAESRQRRAGRDGDRRSALSAAAVADAEFDVADGIRIHETPLHFDVPTGRLFGILAEPLGAHRELCLVLLNAGAQRRIGVNRMWVELARRWAARGVPSLRLDLTAIGDADGESGRFTDLASFYVPEYVDRVREALDVLQRRDLPGRFVMLGLCSGAYWSLYTALADRRVSCALMLNTRVLVWDADLPKRRDSERLRRSALSAGAWRRVVSGATSRARVIAGLRAVALHLWSAPARSLQSLRARGGGSVEHGNEAERRFDALRDRGQRALLLFTAGEPVYIELERDGQLERLDRWPNLTLLADERLRSGSEADHTLRPLWLQRHVHELLDAALEQELAAVSQAPADDVRDAAADRVSARSRR